MKFCAGLLIKTLPQSSLGYVTSPDIPHYSRAHVCLPNELRSIHKIHFAMNWSGGQPAFEVILGMYFA